MFLVGRPGSESKPADQVAMEEADLDALLRSSQAPSQAAWELVHDHLARLATEVKDLKKQVHVLCLVPWALRLLGPLCTSPDAPCLVASRRVPLRVCCSLCIRPLRLPALPRFISTVSVSVSVLIVPY